MSPLISILIVFCRHKSRGGLQSVISIVLQVRANLMPTCTSQIQEKAEKIERNNDRPHSRNIIWGLHVPFVIMFLILLRRPSRGPEWCHLIYFEIWQERSNVLTHQIGNSWCVWRHGVPATAVYISSVFMYLCQCKTLCNIVCWILFCFQLLLLHCFLSHCYFSAYVGVSCSTFLSALICGGIY